MHLYAMQPPLERPDVIPSKGTGSFNDLYTASPPSLPLPPFPPLTPLYRSCPQTLHIHTPSPTLHISGKWFKMHLMKGEGGNTATRVGVQWRVREFDAGQYGTGVGYDATIPEADAQLRLVDFVKGVYALLEYSAGGNGTGCDSRRLNSLINIDRSPTHQLVLPPLLNMGQGTT